MSDEGQRRVVKVGGSLLTRPSFISDLRLWVEQQPDAENFFIFGGGEIIDVVRRMDEIHGLESEFSHWFSVALLDTSFQLACHWLSDWQTIETSQELTEELASIGERPALAMNHLVCVKSFYHPKAPGDLPQDWRTTSDSIAAWLAHQIDADELVLLKSCEVDPQDSLSQLTQSGVVDQAFASAAKGIPDLRIEKRTGTSEQGSRC